MTSGTRWNGPTGSSTARLRSSRNARLRVEVEIPAVLTTDRYDIGEIRLTLPELIAAGQVFLDDKPMKFFDRFILDSRDPQNPKTQRSHGYHPSILNVCNRETEQDFAVKVDSRRLEAALRGLDLESPGTRSGKPPR